MTACFPVPLGYYWVCTSKIACHPHLHILKMTIKLIPLRLLWTNSLKYKNQSVILQLGIINMFKLLQSNVSIQPLKTSVIPVSKFNQYLRQNTDFINFMHLKDYYVQILQLAQNGQQTVTLQTVCWQQYFRQASPVKPQP
jgi:hypothetical protein